MVALKYKDGVLMAADMGGRKESVKYRNSVSLLSLEIGLNVLDLFQLTFSFSGGIV